MDMNDKTECRGEVENEKKAQKEKLRGGWLSL